MPRPATEQIWYASLPRSTRSATIFGALIMCFTTIGFGVWGNSAPIAGAVVTSGVFVVTSQNKIVQHLEGGIIRNIAVNEGDIVDVGQTLVELDETAPRAELRRLLLRRTRLMAMDARLQTEMREEREISFPSDILAAANQPEITEILDSQKLAFWARRNNVDSEIASIMEGINALQERIQGSNVQLAGVRRQIKLVEEEIQAKEILLRTGLVRKPEVLALQRAQASLEGEVGRLIGEIGDAKERIARSLEQVTGVRRTAIKAAVEQLHEVRGELVDVRERLGAAKGVLDRITIVAPVKGVVVKLRYHTQGGVIEPGKNILEILPLQDELIIEGRIRPQDIDNVRRGQHAMVRLNALNHRTTPMIAGEVIYVSADVLPDEKKSPQLGPGDIYIARIKLNAAEAATIPSFVPTPGMPVEIYIKTGERTFFQYLARPIQDSMSRAFRER
jgi:HlyD family secretion protein